MVDINDERFKIQFADGTYHAIQSLSITGSLQLEGTMHVCIDKDSNCIISEDDVVMIPRGEYNALRRGGGE